MRRPVLVVQDDLLTQSALRTVMVAPITSNMRRAEAVGNVPLAPRDSGLDRPSVVLICQVTTVDEDFLTELVGSIPTRCRRRVDDGLKIALSLR
jgi:mRNA interferase MazF